MGRKILLITTDQMRYDALGCNGNRDILTPTLDRLALEGINYRQAIAQNVVCMPSRATIITGQHPDMHGVWMNGVPLPVDSPSIAHELKACGYKTALIGKAHFEPWFASGDFYENEMAKRNEYGPHRGFDHMELVNHFITGGAHYDIWMQREHSDHIDDFYPILSEDGQQNHKGGGATGAIQCWHNKIPRALYHTDWVANRTLAFLDSLKDQEDWFIWMSFPDPHHPWDPPQEELKRIPWQALGLPDLWSQDHQARVKLLENKPPHWLAAYEARVHTNYEMPANFVPAALTDDHVREINAMTHIENELIDEACAKVLAHIEKRGWKDDTDIFFTTDHGELQGDFGLMFKGPFHVNALLHLPFIWRPAKSAALKPCEITTPVGHVDLAPTFCEIAGIEVPAWMQGQVLPTTLQETRPRALTIWESVHTGSRGGARKPITPEQAPSDAMRISLKTISREGYRCTSYGAGSLYEGCEGELYDLGQDPDERHNLWDDPKRQGLKSDLIADMRDGWPEKRAQRLARVSPA